MSGQPGGVLCAGTILVDVGKVIDAYPALDHLATIEQISLSTGGPGLNMAVDLRMLGADFPIGVLGAVGDDEHGALILAECARLGIDTAGVRKFLTAMIRLERSDTPDPPKASRARKPKAAKASKA